MSNGTASKCPFNHAATGGTSNSDWWPNQLKLGKLRQHSELSNPMSEGFDYAEEFKTLDLAMPLSAANIVREILFVPPSARVIDLLERMQAKQIHLALVVDEYGGTDGIVSIEDIVEQIVGEIADEHDEDAEVDVVQQTDGSYVADARAKIEDVVHIVGKDFDIGDAAEEVDTLGIDEPESKCKFE